MTQALLACSLLWGYKWNGPQSHFGPWLFWFPRNLDPEKFGPRDVWAPHEKAMWWFSCGDQISWGPYFSGPKLLGAKISWGPKKSGVQMRLGTISVTASCGPSFKCNVSSLHLLMYAKSVLLNLSLCTKVFVFFVWLQASTFFC